MINLGEWRRCLKSNCFFLFIFFFQDMSILRWNPVYLQLVWDVSYGIRKHIYLANRSSNQQMSKALSQRRERSEGVKLHWPLSLHVVVVVVVCSAEARGWRERRITAVIFPTSGFGDSGVIWGYVLLKALTLSDQCSFQNDTPLLVALAVLRGELVDPAQFAVTVLAADVPHHVSAGEHHSVLHLTVLEVHHLIEEKSSACGSCEPCGDQLWSIRQDGVTVGTREQARSTNVVQKDASHFEIFLRWLDTVGLLVVVALLFF